MKSMEIADVPLAAEDHKLANRQINLEEEEVLKLELWEYEAVVFEIEDYER